MNVPDKVRKEIQRKLWSIADSIDWASLPSPQKATYYEQWSRDEHIGGLLANYLDTRQIRVYIKDTILKSYTRDQMADPERVLRILGLNKAPEDAEIFIKPHGRRLKDGRVFCWGRAEDWKSVLMAVYERAQMAPIGKPYAAVLLRATGRYKEESARNLVDEAARRLRIEALHWIEGH